MCRKILLVYEGSTISAAVLRQGAELASPCKAEWHLLGIVVTTGAMGIAESVGPGELGAGSRSCSGSRKLSYRAFRVKA